MVDLLAIFATSFVIGLSGVLSPGPLSALAISEGVRRGFWAGPRLAAGHALVEGPLVAAIAFGLSAWLSQPLVAGTIGLVGGAILIWMGYGLIVGAWKGQLSLQLQVSTCGRGPGEPGSASATAIPWATSLGLVPAGAIFSLSNPFWSLWWASVGAGLILAARAAGPVGVGVFYLAHWLTDLGWLCLLTFITSSGRRFISDGLYRSVLIACGFFLILFALYFVVAGVRAFGQI
jgi:threonine/homoserine/homoserine lactone efflux protein